uniref:Uncharacterized protein n=1 Tax=Anguilla anguilla TaxID=7936 RepID=A0A0E9SP64_ANGAN
MTQKSYIPKPVISTKSHFTDEGSMPKTFECFQNLGPPKNTTAHPSFRDKTI